MIFDIIEARLITDGFTPGRDLFRLYFPAEIAVGVMVRIPLEGIPIDHEIPDRYMGRIQVIVRHKDPVEIDRLAARVQRLVTIKSRQVFEPSDERGRAVIDHLLPETLPISFPRLEGNGYEISQHYTTSFAVKPL